MKLYASIIKTFQRKQHYVDNLSHSGMLNRERNSMTPSNGG
jgi:hypothetical protein